MDMKAVSLFAGIGGFDLAMERAGIEPVATAEIDKAARSVLGRHFPSAIHYDDVRKVDFSLGNEGIEIVSAGWPCQGNSVAGLRAGMADARSGLWSECVRVVECLRPRWFVGENVPGLLTVNGGRDFRAVITDLVQLGYGVAWRVLDAQGFGVPQRRRRVLIVGYLGDPGRAVEILFEPESSGGDFAPRRGPSCDVAGTLEASAGSGGASANRPGRLVVAPTISAGQGGHNYPGARNAGINPGLLVVGTLQGGGTRDYRVGAEDARDGHLIAVSVRGDYFQTLTATAAKQPSEDGTGRGLPIVSYGVGVRRLMPVECERLQGFPDGWTDGQSDAARYRQLGNAVAVPVVSWVMDRIAASAAELEMAA